MHNLNYLFWGSLMDYLLRGVSDELWRKAKAKATLQGFNMKQLLTFLLEAWVGENIKIGPPGEPEKVEYSGS